MTKLFCSLAVLLSLTGCAHYRDMFGRVETSEDRERAVRLSGIQESQLGLPSARQRTFIHENYYAAEQLLTNLSHRLDATQPLIICTVVDIDNLSKSSTAGRLITSQLSSRFQQLGFNVIQLEARDVITPINGQGMLLLSRDAREMRGTYKAQAVVVGTLGSTIDGGFVHLEILDGNSVLSTTDYALPRM